METTWEFSAYNTESEYGFGTEREARIYLDFLNKDREINWYEMSEAALSDEQAEQLAFNLADGLVELGLI